MSTKKRGIRLDHAHINAALAEIHSGTKGTANNTDSWPIFCDVFIAGSGPIGATFASTIIKEHKTAKVVMAEIGSQDSLVAGSHHKNSIKYQKDIDAFVHVIKGALQPISISPSDTNITTLGGAGWIPPVEGVRNLIIEGHNPNQDPRRNLAASAMTRTVGGMATHWTCNCPVPHKEERQLNPIKKEELDGLLGESRVLLKVRDDQFSHSIRHTVVREALGDYAGRGLVHMPLAAQRESQDNPYVTWSGTDTILKTASDCPERFELLTETRVTQLWLDADTKNQISAVLVRDLRTNSDQLIIAKAFVIACGAVGTPQILFNSGITPKTLGKRLTEQSLSFCQIVLKRSIIEGIPKDPRFKERVERHQDKHPKDPLPIPFDDPEPQVMIPYSDKFPWHIQIHRDAFSYGDVGPKADPRLVVDIRCFGRQDIVEDNRVDFGPLEPMPLGWKPGDTDIYGMPQATFDVVRGRNGKTGDDGDLQRDHRMMKDMCEIANALGSFLPGSEPQFMEPGLALHITGTTRIGENQTTSVADPNSKVHGIKNLYVGGNGCIPDSTACNPTLTSMAIALKSARYIIAQLNLEPTPE